MVSTASLLGAQHLKGIVWWTSRQACLLWPWARHLTGRLHLYVADRWSTRTSTDYNYEIANPACRKRRLLGTHQWQSALLVVGLPVTHDWFEMGCHLFPSLISIRLTAWIWIAVRAVPPSRGREGVTTNKQTRLLAVWGRSFHNFLSTGPSLRCSLIQSFLCDQHAWFSKIVKSRSFRVRRGVPQDTFLVLFFSSMTFLVLYNRGQKFNTTFAKNAHFTTKAS